jgi:hypothetical protein
MYISDEDVDIIENTARDRVDMNGVHVGVGVEKQRGSRR